MKNKIMKKKGMLLLSVLLLCSSTTVSAAGQTKDGIKSRGRISFNNKTPENTGDDILFDAADMLHIADRIEILTEVCR